MKRYLKRYVGGIAEGFAVPLFFNNLRLKKGFWSG